MSGKRRRPRLPYALAIGATVQPGLGGTDGRAILQAIEQANLFLAPPVTARP